MLGNALFTDRERPCLQPGNAVQMQLNIRSSETVKILGFLMANVANKAMSARYGGNETLVSSSHSDMRH